MLLGSLFEGVITSTLGLNLVEGLIRVVILVGYMLLASLPKDMQRVFAYHGAEHKTIRCYEAGLPLTVENVRQQTRLHPRCGTSFLLVVMLLSILVFTVAISVLLEVFPALEALEGTFRFRLFKIAVKLLLLPLLVAMLIAGTIAYYTAGMLLTKSFRVFRGSGKGLGAALLVIWPVLAVIAAFLPINW